MRDNRIGYARLGDGFPDNQWQALLHAGCSIIYEEHLSSRSRKQPVLDMCISAMEPGSELFILDNRVIADTLQPLVDVLEILQEKECRLASIRSGVHSTSFAQTNLAMNLAASYTEFYYASFAKAAPKIPRETNDLASYLDSLGVPPPPPRSWADVPAEQITAMLEELNPEPADPLEQLRGRTRHWWHVVEHLRPRLTFIEIFDRLENPRPNKPSEFVVDVKALVASGDIDPKVLLPTKRMTRREIVAAVHRARQLEPDCQLYTLVKRLDEAAIPPLDQVRWTPLGIQRILTSQP